MFRCRGAISGNFSTAFVVTELDFPVQLHSLLCELLDPKIQLETLVSKIGTVRLNGKHSAELRHKTVKEQ